MAIHKTRGFILKREDVRETSLLLTVYTRDFGKLSLISKGVRIPEQRFLSAYELFALDEIIFYERKRKGALLLSQCELVEFFPRIRASLERLSYASYFAELVNAVTQPEDPNEKLYELMLKALRFLSGEASPKRVARVFEIKLLSLLGFMPALGACAICGGKRENGKVRFSLASGGVVCEKCFGKDRTARSILPGTLNFVSSIESLSLEKVDRVRVTRNVGKEVEALLGSFIRYHLDTRLRTLEFIKKVSL